MCGRSRGGRFFCCFFLIFGVLVAASVAKAFEAFDGRLQVHGYGEVQMRGLASDWEASDDWDLAQWYNILNLEIEWDIAPNGFGPFSLVSAYARVEGRYDCVWRGGCGLFDSVDTFGDRADHLPKRLVGGRSGGFTGVQETGERRRLHSLQRDELDFRDRNTPVGGSRDPAYAFMLPGLNSLYNQSGFDGEVSTEDDPALYVFNHFFDPNGSEKNKYRFAIRKVKGNVDGNGVQVLGPWLPHNKIIPIAVLADRANPRRPGDIHPEFGIPGSGALPFRPVPEADFDANTNNLVSRGLYIPNFRLVQFLKDDEFDNFDQNFRQEELEWNRGASQQDEKELKEIYFDVEALDGRLWIRGGKQNIVWGKTELFRTTDQFNPQDLALASLPSLEESRIALWALRMVYSFWDVGPLEDVRLELAVNFDQFEPTDIGRCGEPFSPNPVCDKTIGLAFHGAGGVGLAGEIRPENPWSSWEGLEIGARMEFRWSRFSVQISDFYGYNDLPYVDRFFTYERNVDPETGRPRRAFMHGECVTGLEDSCLRSGDEALTHHSSNLQLFDVICASSLGFSTSIDPTACGLTIFNSGNVVTSAALGPVVPVVTAVSALLAGPQTSPLNLNGALALAGLLGTTDPTIGNQVLVRLNQDPMDCVLPTCDPAGIGPRISGTTGVLPLGDVFLQVAMSRYLTDEQEALLGCGPLFGTSCDLSPGGVDLFNAEASALMQAWSVFEGAGREILDTFDDGRSQPGTVGFDEGGPVCTRYENGKTFILPGCRGPGDKDYDPNVDGSVVGMAASAFGVLSNNQIRHPFTNQLFKNEIAGVSWNALMGLVALSGLGEDDKSLINVFDPANPFAEGKCSFRNPSFCSNVGTLLTLTGVQRNIVRAGGNGTFGRRDWAWQGGAAGVLRYEKRNVFGISLDFAEDMTKSNWSLEFAWIEGMPTTDNNEFDGLTDVDQFNLTVSVDRPTFINFLNQNRTFLINTQWFFQWLRGYENSFPSHGPLNVLATFTVQTGYFQDRLLPTATLVYDFQSRSGAVLPSITYRFTENFSAQFGVAFFFGRFDRRTQAIIPLGLISNQAGRDTYRSFVENGLSPVRDRDEAFLRIRYTF